MALELKQSLKLTQQLVMTPQLQQAIKLLQLSRVELLDIIRQEMKENPVLEETQEAGEGKTESEIQISEEISPSGDETADSAPPPRRLILIGRTIFTMTQKHPGNLPSLIGRK
jgi:RNA polymerase sigma-54 factor